MKNARKLVDHKDGTFFPRKEMIVIKKHNLTRSYYEKQLFFVSKNI